MQDSNVRPGDTSGYIPIISPTLHCIAMTGVVFLRSSFGYIYLRHKAIFLSLGYAQVLYSIYAWNEPQIWARHHAEVIFGISAFVLYLIHLSFAVGHNIKETANRDKYSGKSHLLRILPLKGKNAEMYVHLWVEPAVILGVSFFLRFILEERGLARWLLFVAVSLCLKEMINYWHRIRSKKRAADALEDAQERFEDYTQTESPASNRKSPRVSKTRRPRASNAKENFFANLLNLHHPYTLEEVEANYRQLIKECHPDGKSEVEKDDERAKQLNEARDYFHQKLGTN